MTNTYPVPDTIAIASATRPSLSVYDGQTRLGYLVRRPSNRSTCNFEAFDINDTSYGVFPDMKTAAFAIPAKGGAS